MGQLAAQVSELAGAAAELERPPQPEHGDYATNVALRLAASKRRPPRELAAELAESAASLDAVERAEVAGPGFLNLWVRDEWLADGVRAVGADFGAGCAEHRERVQVEMVSANPTGPVTVASARNGAYGDCVARLLEYAGNEVEREYYYNDAGAQMERFRASVEAVRRGEQIPDDGYHGDYIAELAAVDGDPVPPMLEQIARTLERFRIHFDSWTLQSELESQLSEVLVSLPTYERDGAVWAHSTEYGDVVFLDELMDQIGVDAARWYLVNRGPDQTIEIDVDLAAEKTQKNPVYYVQYAHARIAGILRNAFGEEAAAEWISSLAQEERALVKRLLEFPQVVREATIRRGPHAIPAYAIRVADDFHRFYHEHRVIGSANEAFRLQLVRATQRVIARSLDLVGVEAPERM